MRRPTSLRGKLIAVTLAMLAIIGAATLYSSFATATLARSLSLLFERNQLIEGIRTGLADSARALADYLGSGSADNLTNFQASSRLLADRSKALDREVRDDEAVLLQRELAGLIDRYLLDAGTAVVAKQDRYISTFTAKFESSERTAALARSIIERIERRNLNVSIDAYTGLDSRIAAITGTNVAIVVAAVLMAFTVFLQYVWSLTGPLSTLAESARYIARGNYDRELPHITAAEEITTMASAFENMRQSVRSAFDELRLKAEIERRLMEEELRLVDMDRKLKDTELLALQAQINPHFLFNTLQAGMQLALVEGSDRTADFLDNLAVFIRYAIKPVSRFVAVSDEIECIDRYIWLLKLRFGERFSFDVQADEAALGVATPALVLQPLVENAVTHGLRDRESGGLVRVRAAFDAATSSALLTVEDNGEGMASADAARLLRESAGDGGSPQNGIGLRNVIKRVLLATDGKGRVELESDLGKGMTVRILLPSGGQS
jgi:HAMP domain-containing protein